MLLFVLSGQGFTDIVNTEEVAAAIIGPLVGSVGIVAAVPVTTYLAARLVSLEEHEEPNDDDTHHDEPDQHDAVLHPSADPTPSAKKRATPPLLTEDELAKWHQHGDDEPKRD